MFCRVVYLFGCVCRIVAAGSDLIGSLDISSAQTYRFDDVLQLDYDTVSSIQLY